MKLHVSLSLRRYSKFKLNDPLTLSLSPTHALCFCCIFYMYITFTCVSIEYLICIEILVKLTKTKCVWKTYFLLASFLPTFNCEKFYESFILCEFLFTTLEMLSNVVSVKLIFALWRYTHAVLSCDAWTLNKKRLCYRITQSASEKKVERVFFCLGKHIKCHANWLSKRLIKELELSHYLWNLIYNGNANGNNNMFSVNSKCFVGLFLHAIELREIVEKLSEIQKVPP